MRNSYILEIQTHINILSKQIVNSKQSVTQYGIGEFASRYTT